MKREIKKVSVADGNAMYDLYVNDHDAELAYTDERGRSSKRAQVASGRVQVHVGGQCYFDVPLKVLYDFQEKGIDLVEVLSPTYGLS